MANVIVIVQDDRVRRQIEQFVQELGLEDLRFATFKLNSEFQALYFRDRSKDPPAPPPEGEEASKDGADLKLFSEVHLVIFALDSIGEKSAPWLDKLRTNMKKFKYWPENGTRMMMLKFEDDGISKLDLLHPMLDDLIYLPLDRLVFLQKTQIFLGLPKRVSAKFLFNQEVKHPIEISKITKIDRLSDVALAIRNPVPLKKGLPGHFYVTLPGEKTRLEVRGKVLRSEPHPDVPGNYLVYFAYFGLAKSSLTQIRRALSKAPRYQSLISDDREKVRFDANGLFNTEEESQMFGISVIDSDDMAAQNLAQTLTKDMDRLSVAAESSFQIFLMKNFEKDSMGDGTPPKPSDDTHFYRNPISLSVSVADLKCVSVDPGPDNDATFFGHNALTIFSEPEGWLRIMDSKESKLIMEEAVQLVARGRVLQKLMTIKDNEQVRRAANFRIYKGASDQVITVEISPANLNDIMARLSSMQKETSLNTLILESSFAPEDPTSWIEGLRMRAVQVNLAKTPDQLKFFFITDSEQPKAFLNWLNCPDILNVFLRPVDNRQLLFLLSEYLPNKNTVYQFDNVGWSSPSLNVHVAKNVELEALSEYGATLKTKQKLAPGTMVYLRKSIFNNAPNGCLAARVYACEDHSSDKGYYQIYTTYFGINDAFLKFARTWIRENYASQKSQPD